MVAVAVEFGSETTARPDMKATHLMHPEKIYQLMTDCFIRRMEMARFESERSVGVGLKG